MQLGMVGLGRMGGNMTIRLGKAGHDVKTFDPQVDSTATTLEELAQQLDAPRSVWLMVPAGIVDDVVSELAPHLEEGDTIVDDTGKEIPIPGKDFGFGKLIRAQAAGDFASLQERGRPIVRIRLEDL